MGVGGLDAVARAAELEGQLHHAERRIRQLSGKVAWH